MTAVRRFELGPVPDGSIEADPDYTRRPEPEATIAALRAL